MALTVLSGFSVDICLVPLKIGTFPSASECHAKRVLVSSLSAGVNRETGSLLEHEQREPGVFPARSSGSLLEDKLCAMC